MQNTLEKEIVKILPKVRQYSPDVQSKIIQFYILYLLKSEKVTDVLNICRALQQKFSVKPNYYAADQSLEKNEVENNKDSADQIINNLMMLIGLELEPEASIQEKLVLIQESLVSMSESFLSLELSSRANELNLLGLAGLVSQNIIDNKIASKYAAENGFNRLFEAFDPEKAERYLDQSIERKGVDKKAAMYDAMQEKFEQLFEYKQQGRMLKDFRRDFKSKLRKQKSD